MRPSGSSQRAQSVCLREADLKDVFTLGWCGLGRLRGRYGLVWCCLDLCAILRAMIQRKQPGRFYAYPDHLFGIGGWTRRLLWKLGFDPLTVRERLEQVEVEREYWKCSYNDLCDRVERSGCELVA